MVTSNKLLLSNLNRKLKLVHGCIQLQDYVYPELGSSHLDHLFVIGFLEGLKRGHENRPPNYRSLVLLRLIVKSSLGAAILGAKSINEKFPVDYSKNTESFFTFTPSC